MKLTLETTETLRFTKGWQNYCCKLIWFLYYKCSASKIPVNYISNKFIYGFVKLQYELCSIISFRSCGYSLLTGGRRAFRH